MVAMMSYFLQKNTTNNVKTWINIQDIILFKMPEAIENNKKLKTK